MILCVSNIFFFIMFCCHCIPLFLPSRPALACVICLYCVVVGVCWGAFAVLLVCDFLLYLFLFVVLLVFVCLGV